MLRMLSPLFVPGNKPERFSKALASGADAVIYDLEDAVSMEDKDRARTAIADRSKTSVYEIVRVNSSSSGLLDLDLRAISANPPCAVMLAKAEGGDDLKQVVNVLGMQARIIPLVETALGMAKLPEILVDNTVLCAAFGSIDFALDIGCCHERLPLLRARSELVMLSRLANCQAPIDGVTTAIDDIPQIKEDASHAKDLGFGGKLAIHPRQISPILSSFTVTDPELEWAKRILHWTADGNAKKLEGIMIDRPVIERAKNIVARAQTALPFDGSWPP